MEVVTTRAELDELLRPARRLERSVGLVPTMGALHRGHRSLIDTARGANDVVALWIFVNPLQFNDRHDLTAYPRDLAADLAVAKAGGVDVVFAPSTDEVYPTGEPAITVDPGRFGTGLEGSQRPGHFVGVATVVAKMLVMVDPVRAYFGEKDFEQLTLVRRLARELSFSTEIVACPTVREDDGLALSSRNTRLTPSERAAAPVLYRALQAGRSALEAGSTPAGAESAMAAVLAAEPLAAMEYAAVRDEATLGGPVTGAPLRLLVAARFGAVRLIDNVAGPSAVGLG